MAVMDVGDVLRDRMQQPGGLQRMVAVSILLHTGLIVAVFLAPKGFLTGATEPRSVMTISLGEGSGGASTGGMTAISARPVQAVTPPDEPAKREALRPPAAKTPEMTVPLPNAKPVKASPAPPPVKQAPDEARGRTPSRGAEVREGSAVAETGARGQGFGGLSSGGAGSGLTLDVADFCCPDYLVTMSDRLKNNWDENAGAAPAAVVVRFTIRRDGMLSNIEVQRSSGNPLADNAAARAVIITRQLPPLPMQFPNPSLTVNLTFQYTR